MRPIAPKPQPCPSGVHGRTRRVASLVSWYPARTQGAPESPHRPKPGTSAVATAMAALSLALLATGAPSPALASEASGATRLRGASAEAGHKLIAEHNCSACHVRKVGGDGSGIYRPKGRINTPSALLGMVEMCNTELGLQMFPEDVADVAAALNARHYRFKLTPP